MTEKEERKKNKAAQELAKLGASKGGKARWKKVSKKERSRIMKKVINARWKKNRKQKVPKGGKDND